jgi:uncharacterized protein (TIGR02001 family)
MKNDLLVSKFLAIAVLGLVATPLSVRGQGGSVTANVGWVSEYLYRGIPQQGSSASAGIDAELAGLYVGSWAADVGTGSEVDVYAGYRAEAGIFSLGVGGTGYYYTDQFDDRYLELNFSAGIGPLSAEYSIGEYDTAPTSVRYRFFGLTVEHQGGYLTVGSFGDGFDGEYGEAGYGFTASELDLSIAWIFSTAELLAARDRTLVFGVSKTFDLR